VISEIDYASKALEEAAARGRELEDSIKALKVEIEERKNARPEEESAHIQVAEAWEARKEALKVEVHDLVAEAKSIEEGIAPKHRARFMRLLESKKGTAVAAVAEGSCSLCHFALRPHLQQRVRRCEELISCEHCHRILFVEDLLDEIATDGNG
jgi:predicted  nucleic acid-binding Zn-ribbon protein